jgi:hypothetical protein
MKKAGLKAIKKVEKITKTLKQSQLWEKLSSEKHYIFHVSGNLDSFNSHLVGT